MRNYLKFISIAFFFLLLTSCSNQPEVKTIYFSKGIIPYDAYNVLSIKNMCLSFVERSCWGWVKADKCKDVLALKVCYKKDSNLEKDLNLIQSQQKKFDEG